VKGVFMFKALRRRWRNSSATVDLLNQAVAGIANQTDLLNRRMDQLIAGIANQTDVLNRKLQENIAGITNLAHLVNRHGRLGPMQPGQLPQLPNSAQTPPQVMDRLSALLGKPNDNAGPARETAAAALADLCVSALSTGEDRVAFFDRLVATLLPLDHSRVFWGDRMLLLDKNMGFIEDAVFADAYNEIKDNKTFNQYRSPTPSAGVCTCSRGRPSTPFRSTAISSNAACSKAIALRSWPR